MKPSEELFAKSPAATHIQTGKPFGKIPVALRDTITPEQIEAKRKRCEMLFINYIDAPETEQDVIADEYLVSLRDFRLHLGAYWSKLFSDLHAEVPKSHNIASNFLLSSWESMFARKYKPYKFYGLCGHSRSEFGRQCLHLMNMPPFQGEKKTQIFKEWGFDSQDSFVAEIDRKRAYLESKEKEYRETAVLIYSLGLGMGGLIMGIISLFLSVIFAFYQK